MNRLFSYFRVAMLLAVCASVSACGKNETPLGEIAPVSGKVTVDGQAVTAGQVALIPVDSSTNTGGSVCAGQIDATGTYTIFTAGKEGAPIGKYKATVTVSMVPSGATKMPTAPFNAKYMDQAKSTLLIEVKANAAPGAYDLKLTK